MFFRSLLVILPLAGAVTLTAQSEGQRALFRSSLDVVPVAVVVKDANGRLVTDLDAADFEILDQGAARPIVQFERGTDNDARLALLVDSSGSMVFADRRQRSRLATELLLAGFTDRDAASVFSFDSGIRRLTPFTRDPHVLRTAVMSVEPFGATSLYDAIVATVRTIVDDAPRARGVLLVTDGIDTASAVTPQEAASAAAAVDMPLYVLSVGGSTAEDRVMTAARAAAPMVTLHELATRTGGLAAEAATIAQLSAATRNILTELRHQYVLAIHAAETRGWHELTVRVRRGRVQARSRNGYFVS
ncbi:MAG TPA: VWA domain-containing protein [Vicinamibacterales bacterium]|nr:VWA domain-containing protein [Vicinamibacterales bacterium]